MYENPPKIFTDEQGVEKGIFSAILEYVAEREGFQIEYVHGSFSEGLHRLGNGEIHIMQDVAWSEERDQLYAFTNETVLADWGRLYARSGLDVQTFPGLEGMRIGVMKDGIYNIGPEGIRHLLAVLDINATFIEYPSYRDIFEALGAGHVDVGAVNRFFGRAFEGEYDVYRTNLMFTPISIRFALNRDHWMTPELIDTLDGHLREIKADPDSVYYASIDEFMGGAREGEVFFPTWARIAILVVAGGALLFFGTSIILKRKVDQRTEELRKDIRERKKVEKELREHRENLEKMVNERTEELQRSLDDLKILTYSVSHDLKAPLRSMTCFSQILLEEHEDISEETRVDYLDRIRDSAQNMDILISDLLRYGQLTHEEMELGVVSLEEMMENILRDLDEDIKEEGAHIRIIGVMPKVRANKQVLKQCVTNLLTNSMKFVSEGRAPEVEIRTERMVDIVRVEFRDNGIGIPREHQDEVFDVFKRLHGIESYPGTGIGLAIVRKGMERMGGRVGVSSEPGEGSTFWFELPSV